MRELDELIVLALLDTLLLHRHLRTVPLLEQPQRANTLVDLQPFGKPRLPVLMRGVDRSPGSVDFRSLRLLQAVHFLQMRG
jgi:hypothetical protein